MLLTQVIAEVLICAETNSTKQNADDRVLATWPGSGTDWAGYSVLLAIAILLWSAAPTVY
jgi:hypothetical protein